MRQLGPATSESSQHQRGFRECSSLHANAALIHAKDAKEQVGVTDPGTHDVFDERGAVSPSHFVSTGSCENTVFAAAHENE